MIFDLTSSQKVFYTEKIDNSIWTQGALQVFSHVYSYKELNDAFNSLVENNDGLLIHIEKTDDKPIAVLEEYRYTNYPFVSFESEEELYVYLKEYLNKPISLFERLVECVVFNTPYSSGIIVNSHHIAVDGYSGFVMAQYINNFLKNADTFSEDTENYVSFIEKKTKYRQSKRFISDSKFWLEQFSQKPSTQIFANNNQVQNYKAAECNYEIAEELFDKIKKFCSENEVSIATFFDTVYTSFLYQKYALTHFTIGVPVLNRTSKAELNTIGLYMHIVPLVVSVKENDSFSELLKRNEDSQMNLFRHQKFSQYDIKQWLKENDLEVNQLFDIIADYEEFGLNEDYSLTIHYSDAVSVPLEIHLFNNTISQNLKIRYRAAMFSEKYIQSMLGSIIAIAEDALENPDKKICDLEMLSAAQKHKVLYGFNDTAHLYSIPERSTLYSLFEKTAEENPDKTCIKSQMQEVSFGELLGISENLDCEIRTITGGEKAVIAVMAERSVEMYSAIYGIIRGGNAYLPIDPDYPEERINYILENSGAAAAVVQGKFADKIKSIPCINMTEQLKNLSVRKEEVPDAAAEADDTAYVIYTSGSTGNPKGVKISHKSALNRILWMHDKYPLGSDDTILQKTPYTFDVSVWEHFWWGICGGSLAVSKPGEHFLPVKILDEAYKHNVTHLHFVPSVFEIFLSYLESHTDEQYKFGSVKHVFLSGEALSAGLVHRFYKIYDHSRVALHNLYGPTECAVDVTYYDCAPSDNDPVPIGKPIYNTQMYVVDKNNNIVPVGVTGELCVAGANVGQGYLNNPELTAERFIVNPFGEGRLYKTGDLAYWSEDGKLIFCGRIDGQIKLNGQRIEVGEIESVICDHEKVESAAVIVRRLASKDTLVAFYTGESGAEEAIRSLCKNKLPKYMVPSVCVHLDELPLNPSGKLDKRVLEKYRLDDLHSAENELPSDEAERFVCEAFSFVLGVDSIGRNTDFFEIGGTSLSMISLLSEKGFEGITSAEFIRNPTPAGVADVLRGNEQAKSRYLETLYTSACQDKVLILLPFAGGGAEAYSDFVNELKRKADNISVYFIRYLHSSEDCVNAANEIAEIFADRRIFIYSHCVGAAVAMQIISMLESRGVFIRHYFAGGFIPPARPSGKNLWKNVPDRVLKAVLSKEGARLSGLSEKSLKEMLTRFRKDTDFASNSLAVFDKRIKAPVSIIMTRSDLFTYNHRQAFKIWKKYAEKVEGIHYLDLKTHYFQSEGCEELIKVLLSYM